VSQALRLRRNCIPYNNLTHNLRGISSRSRFPHPNTFAASRLGHCNNALHSASARYARGFPLRGGGFPNVNVQNRSAVGRWGRDRTEGAPSSKRSRRGPDWRRRRRGNVSVRAKARWSAGRRHTDATSRGGCKSPRFRTNPSPGAQALTESRFAYGSVDHARRRTRTRFLRSRCRAVFDIRALPIVGAFDCGQ
jgi:hypothetical protein